MTWRWKLARLLLRDDPDWLILPTAMFEDYLRRLAEEEKVRELIEAHGHLTPVLDLLTPRKNERMH